MKKIALLVMFWLSSLPALCATGPATTYAFDPRCPVDRPFIRSGPILVACSISGKMEKEECKIEAGCVSCNSLESLLMLGNAEDCSKCPNRILDESGRYCRLKECPKDKPFYEATRGCKSCEDEPLFISKEECEQCPGRRWVEVPDSGTADVRNYCAPDLSDRVYHGENRVQITEKGRLLIPLYYMTLPYFTLCSELNGISVSAEECARCPNTYMKDGFCFGKE